MLLHQKFFSRVGVEADALRWDLEVLEKLGFRIRFQVTEYKPRVAVRFVYSRSPVLSSQNTSSFYTWPVLRCALLRTLQHARLLQL